MDGLHLDSKSTRTDIREKLEPENNHSFLYLSQWFQDKDKLRF